MVCLFIFKNVKAVTFDLQRNDNYKFQLTWLNENTNKTINVTMYKITKNGKFYYNLEPKITVFANKEYNESDISIDLNVYKKIAKIIYYGYGYQEFTTDSYYFATQYLIFEALGVDIVKVVDKNTEEEKEDFLKTEIEDIRRILKDTEENNLEYTTSNNFLEISDSYIINNFELISDDISIDITNNVYKINLLNNKREYDIVLKSTDKCLPADYWQSLSGPSLVGKTNLCEEDRILKVIREAKEDELPEIEDRIPDIVDNNLKNEGNIIIPNIIDKEELSIEDTEDIVMPSTSKYSIRWLIMLLLFGNIYYVCKK